MTKATYAMARAHSKGEGGLRECTTAQQPAIATRCRWRHRRVWGARRLHWRCPRRIQFTSSICFCLRTAHILLCSARNKKQKAHPPSPLAPDERALSSSRRAVLLAPASPRRVLQELHELLNYRYIPAAGARTLSVCPSARSLLRKKNRGWAPRVKVRGAPTYTSDEKGGR
jgi:hypothetical protein